MITQQTVLMATPIALLATEKGLDLHEKASDIIKGLDETTASIVSFTPDNIATELPDYTAIVPVHSEVMEVSSTIVADTIRSALYTISKTVKPLLVQAEERIRNQLSAQTAVEAIMDAVNIEMVNIEPEFLNSPFYPSSVAATMEGIDTIALTDLMKGSYPRLSGSELVDYIAVDVPDLMQFFSNPSEVERVYDTLFIDKNFYTIFRGGSINNGFANINNVSNFDFGSFRTLVIATLLLNKFVSLDDPIDGLTGVSLEDYRTSLILSRDLFKTLLYRFKQVWNERAAAGIVILTNTTADTPSVVNNDIGVDNLLGGSVTVGYNRAVLEMFANSDELALSEYVLGFLYAKRRGYQVRDIITDKAVVVAAWKEYCTDISTAQLVSKSKIAVRALCQTLDTAYSKEEFTSIIDAMDDPTTPALRISTRLQNKIDLPMFFNNTSMLDAVIRGDASLMNTLLASLLADCFDCPIAVEILDYNAQTPASTIEQQRKVLACSIDKVIIKRLLAV